MHHIHHTEAFILGFRPKGEDSKMLILYTRELGLVYAHAQGIRKLSSKLRFVLQDFSRVNVDLVRGKELWRVTTASPIHGYASVTHSRSGERIAAHLSSLLMRLVVGEEANEEVFRALSRAYNLLERTDRTEAEDRTLELLSVARILIALGYLSRGVFEESEDISVPKEFSDIAYQHRLIRDINTALNATHL